jgi:hypothetical protein
VHAQVEGRRYAFSGSRLMSPMQHLKQLLRIQLRPVQQRTPPRSKLLWRALLLLIALHLLLVQQPQLQRAVVQQGPGAVLHLPHPAVKGLTKDPSRQPAHLAAQRSSRAASWYHKNRAAGGWLLLMRSAGVWEVLGRTSTSNSRAARTWVQNAKR